jgi:hypothetical protein
MVNTAKPAPDLGICENCGEPLIRWHARNLGHLPKIWTHMDTSSVACDADKSETPPAATEGVSG